MSLSVFSAPPSHGLRKSCTVTMFNVFSSTIFKQCESCQLPQALSRQFSSFLSSITFQLLVHRSLGRRGLSHISAPPNIDCYRSGSSASSGLSLVAVEGAHCQYSSSCNSCARWLAISFHTRPHIGRQSLSPTIT